MFAGKSKKSHLANFTSSVGSVDSYLYQMATIMKRRRAGGWKQRETIGTKREMTRSFFFWSKPLIRGYKEEEPSLNVFRPMVMAC